MQSRNITSVQCLRYTLQESNRVTGNATGQPDALSPYSSAPIVGATLETSIWRERIPHTLRDDQS